MVDLHNLPVPTDDLARRIESAHVEFIIERMEGIGQQPGNPFDVQINRFDGYVTLTAALPLAWMNTAHIIGRPDVIALRQALAVYRDMGRRLRVEVTPADLTPQLSATLADMGLIQQEFHAAVYGTFNGLETQQSEQVEIHPVTASNFEVFLETFLTGFQVSPAAKANMSHWITQSNWRLYLATVDGQPAATGILSVHSEMGYLAAAATIPAFRNRGCQSALINQRIADARGVGCDLIVGQCAYASSSHRNLHRAGLRLAYTKAIWSQP